MVNCSISLHIAYSLPIHDKSVWWTRIVIYSTMLSQTWLTSGDITSTKTRIYQTLVVSVLLYASVTWTLLAADVKTLEAFHMKCQRQILRIRWQDHSHSQRRGRRAYRPTPCDGEHQETTWSHLWACGENVTQHSSPPSIATTGRDITR